MFSSTITSIIITSLIIGTITAFVLSLIINALYKRAVVKGMGFTEKLSKVEPPITPGNDGSGLNLQPVFVNIEGDDLQDTAKYRDLKKFLNRRLMINVFSIMCFTIGWTYLYIEFNIKADAVSFNMILYCSIFFFWAFAFTYNILWATQLKQKVIIYSSYFSLFLITCLLVHLYQSKDSRFTLLAILWLIYNAIPSIIILLLRSGKIKSIGAIVTGFCFTVFFTANLLVVFLASSPDSFNAIWNFFNSIGVTLNFSLLILIAIILSAIIGAVLIWIIKKLYLLKLINEQQLSIDSVLLIFSAFYSLFILSENPSLQKGAFCLFPFLFYKLASFLFYNLLKVSHQNTAPVKLLLLRVFALNKASRISFEKIQKHWQYSGPILMISGPDLATTTIDAHEMVDFVTNNLKKHYCDSNSAIELRLSKADMKPDIDGSFRINEFFCRNSTWKDTLIKLVGMSDVLLFDLRSFSQVHKGCQYEVQQLVNYMPLKKVIVLINAQTNLEFLRSVFTKAFMNIIDQSPNLASISQVQLYFFKHEVSSNFSNLLKSLCNISEKSNEKP